MSFKLAQKQHDEFKLEAVKRKMKQKELFLATWQLYRETFPVSDR
jgi:hypothetical protein